jgi:hypothetical protein
MKTNIGLQTVGKSFENLKNMAIILIIYYILIVVRASSCLLCSCQCHLYRTKRVGNIPPIFAEEDSEFDENE